MGYMIAFYLILLGIIASNSDDAEPEYPLYQGVNCVPGEGQITGWEDLGYYDEYCAHIVCEKPGLCKPHEGAYVYELPVLDYRGAQIIANHPGGSVALLRSDGGAITWGDIEGSLEDRQDIRHQLKSGIREMHASRQGFAVLKNDGSLVTWARDTVLYEKNHSVHTIIDGTSQIAADLSSGVDRLFSGMAGFAALTKNGSVVTWRGDGSSEQWQKIPHLNSNEVEDIVINEAAWAALKKDGSVIAWGSKEHGGEAKAVQQNLRNVLSIYATRSAFAALKESGTIVTWGDPLQGGYPGNISYLLANVVEIVSTQEAFAALKEDWTVVTWGDRGKPYTIESNIKKLVASRGGAFAALKWDNSVITWGINIYGADVGSLVYELKWGVMDIYANHSGFAALKEDGSVLSWGEHTADETFKKMAPYLGAREETDPKRIVTIISSPFTNAFFAIRRDGTFISWGRGAYPYHKVFHDMLDDPVWSKVYPDLEYVHYFGILPKKRQ